MGDDHACVAQYRLSTGYSPHAELPSLGLFVALKRLGEFEGAFQEASRLLSLRRSPEYDAYFDNDYLQEPGLSPAARTLAERAHRLVLGWRARPPS